MHACIVVDLSFRFVLFCLLRRASSCFGFQASWLEKPHTPDCVKVVGYPCPAGLGPRPRRKGREGLAWMFVSIVILT